MPFTYSQYHNPFVGSLSDLMMRPAEAQAAAAERIGQYQAAAQQQSGQAWAGAANQTGQAVSGAIQQATDPRRQLEALNLKEKNTAISDHDTFKKILAKTPQIQENGMNLWDLPTLGDQAVKAGIDPSPYLVEYGKVNDAFRAEGQARMATVQAAAQGLAKAPDPDLAANFLDTAVRNRTIDEGTAKRLQASIDAADTPQAKAAVVQSIAVRYAGPQTPIKLAGAARPGGAPETAFDPLTHQPIATGASAGPAQPTPSSIAMEAAGGDATQANALLHPTPVTSNEWKDVLLDGKPAKVFVDPKTQVVKDLAGNTVDNAVSRIKPIPPASMTINPQLVPSGDALDMAAKRYLLTGDLPSMGMGQAGAAARVAVMNRAAQIDPQASLSANKATYKADTANLQKLQTTEGTLSAFEKTAGKNLDQFLTLADKIPDTGVPWLNQPLRAVNASGLGSSDQAAFNAARDVALREIARVTNDPKLSGSLTDSARAEVAGLSPANATFAQIKAVAKVLKQDMANVHSGINEQISNVKAGLQGHPGAPAVSAPLVPTLRFNPATGKVEPVKSGGDD